MCIASERSLGIFPPGQGYLTLRRDPPRARLEEAQRRKGDYAAYYNLALRYGPLGSEEFDAAPYPGSALHSKVSNAALVVQNWWWGAWPPLFRRRKLAALMVQSVFRGFVQRKRWRVFVRLRLLWGTTRIVSRALAGWKEGASRARRVARFAGRTRVRTLERSFAAWRHQAVVERSEVEKAIIDRLRRSQFGVSQRIFDAWASYAAASRRVEKMRGRSFTRGPFRAWRECTASDRRHRLLIRLCSTIASRALGRAARTRFLELRGACCMAQRLARGKLARVRVRRMIVERRVQQAEQLAQDAEVSARSDPGVQICRGSFTPAVVLFLREGFLVQGLPRVSSRAHSLMDFVARGVSALPCVRLGSCLRLDHSQTKPRRHALSPVPLRRHWTRRMSACVSSWKTNSGVATDSGLRSVRTLRGGKSARLPSCGRRRGRLAWLHIEPS